MGCKTEFKDFYFSVGDEWQKIERAENIPITAEQPVNVETSTIGDFGEAKFNCESSKREIREIRWWYFKEYIKLAFKVLFGKVREYEF